MELNLTREVAYRLVLEKIGHNNLLKHILAVDAGMRKLAERLGEDIEYWGLVGLVGFDLVATIFGGQSALLSRVVYILVGLCAAYQAFSWKAIQRRWEPSSSRT